MHSEKIYKTVLNIGYMIKVRCKKSLEEYVRFWIIEEYLGIYQTYFIQIQNEIQEFSNIFFSYF